MILNLRIPQRWSLSNNSQIRREGLCAHSVRGAMTGSHVRIMQCQKEMSEYRQSLHMGDKLLSVVIVALLFLLLFIFLLLLLLT